MLGVLLTIASCSADPMLLGTFSFDQLVLASQSSSGVNAFTISNYTGDPGVGGFALPPDFPVYSPITFKNIVVTLVSGGMLQTYSVPDVVGGSITPAQLQFPDTLTFDSASISLSLDQASLTLSDSTVFDAIPLVTVTIVPSTGPFLAAGTDFALLAANAAGTEIPEPRSTAAVILASIAFAMKGRRSNVVTTKHAKRSRLILISMILAVAMLVASPGNAQVTLSPAASPSSGQAGITSVNVTGSNFPAGTINASATTVRLDPQPSGTGVITTPSAVTLIAGTTRRVTFLIPATISVSTSTVFKVTVSGSTTTGTAFTTVSTATAALTIGPPSSISSISPNSGAAGQSLSVAITGNLTNFVQGATIARFGPDVSVGGASAGAFGPVKVVGPTSATAQIVINSNANVGAVNVDVQTGSQQASSVNGFSITPPALNTITEYIYLNGRIIAVEKHL